MKISTKQIYLRKIRRTLTARSQNLRKRKGAWWVKSIPSISILSDEWKLYHLYCDGFSFTIKAREIEQEKKKHAQVIMRFRCFFIHIIFGPTNMFSTWQKIRHSRQITGVKLNNNEHDTNAEYSVRCWFSPFLCFPVIPPRSNRTPSVSPASVSH